MINLYAVTHPHQKFGSPNVVDGLKPVVYCMVFLLTSAKGNSTGFSSTKNSDSSMKTDARLPEHACAQQAACLHHLVTTGAAVDPPAEFCQALMLLNYRCASAQTAFVHSHL